MSGLATLSSRDRRAVLIGAALVLPALLFALVLRPLGAALGETRERARSERELLARERGLLTQASSAPSRLRRAESALRLEAPRLFRGADALAAASELEEYVADAAGRSRVSIRQSESREADPGGEGIAALQADVQGEGDLRGILSLVRELDSGPRLVRVERLAIERGGEGTLSFALTAVGYSTSVPLSTGGEAAAP